MTPQKYGPYSIVRKLSAGGMGRVYEAIDNTTGRRVALKLVDHGTDRDSLEIVAAERHGALLQKQLCLLDQRITAVYEFGDYEGYFYIAMEYVEGQDLAELAGSQRIGYPFAARIAQDVLDVLDHAHNLRTTIEGREYRGIVHGDIKPRNIRLTTAGGVRVLDFGIAKALSLTRRFTSNQFGSVLYSSPERLNTGEVTISSDLWAVGVVLYELIARRHYFEGDDGPRLEAAVRSYRELRPLPPDCPEPLQNILRRALAPDPTARYGSAQEFAADLQAFRSGGAVPPPADVEATRRTTPVADDATRRTASFADAETQPLDETRRTVPRAEPFPAPHPEHRGPRVRLRFGRALMIFFLAVGILSGGLVAREYLLWRDSRELARELDSERVSDVDAAWQRYRAIASKTWLGFPAWPAENAIERRMIADADRTIANYRRAENQVIYENEWERARTSVVRALALDPGDRELKGKLRLIDGHLARIRAKGSERVLKQALDNFTEATDLLPKSPDPWLGLARLYVYSFRDVEKAEEALRQADRRGHEMSRRETGQLADGYRLKADREFAEAERSITKEEAERYLDLAKRDYDRARELYESIVPWGNASASLRRVYESRDLVERRKQELEAE